MFELTLPSNLHLSDSGGYPAPAVKMSDSLQPPGSSTQAAPLAGSSSPAAYTQLLPLFPAKLIRHHIPTIVLQVQCGAFRMAEMGVCDNATMS